MSTLKNTGLEGKPGMVTYPPAATERVTDGWLELRLQ